MRTACLVGMYHTNEFSTLPQSGVSLIPIVRSLTQYRGVPPQKDIQLHFMIVNLILLLLLLQIVDYFVFVVVAAAAAFFSRS
jgi:hypothetical protein